MMAAVVGISSTEQALTENASKYNRPDRRAGRLGLCEGNEAGVVIWVISRKWLIRLIIRTSRTLDVVSCKRYLLRWLLELGSLGRSMVNPIRINFRVNIEAALHYQHNVTAYQQQTLFSVGLQVRRYNSAGHVF